MKLRLLIFVWLLAAAAFSGNARADDTAADAAAPVGFDQERDVPHGKVTSETYDSQTLGF
jgi:hypothetical protein